MRSAPPRSTPSRAAATIALVAALLVVVWAPGSGVGSSGAYLSDREAVAAGTLVTRAACTTTPSSYVAAVQALSPTLYWRFSEAAAATTVADSSGNGNAGTVVTSSPTAGVAGPLVLGTAGSGLVQCDDTGLTSPSILGALTSGSFVVLPTARQTRNTFTIMAWVRTTSTAGGRLIGEGDSSTGASANSDRMLFLDDAGHAIFGVVSKNTPYYLRSSAPLNDGRPHFLAASLGSAGATLFVDGVLDQSNPTLTKADKYPANKGYWRVGWDSLSGWGAVQPTDFGLAGIIDEAAVFEGVQLSSAQIAGLWAANHW